METTTVLEVMNSNPSIRTTYMVEANMWKPQEWPHREPKGQHFFKKQKVCNTIPRKFNMVELLQIVMSLK